MKKSLFLIIIVTLIAVLTKFYISNYKIEYKVNDYDVKTIYKNKRFYFEIKKHKIFNFDIYSKRKLSKTKVERIEELDFAVNDGVMATRKTHQIYIQMYPRTL